QSKSRADAFGFQDRGDRFRKRNNFVRVANWEHFQVAPNRRRPAKERFFGEVFLQSVEIIADPKRSLASCAKIVKVSRLIALATMGTFQVSNKIHRGHSS